MEQREELNPEGRRSATRKRKLTKIRTTPEWKAMRAEFLKSHPLCQYHLNTIRKMLKSTDPELVEMCLRGDWAAITEYLTKLGRQDLIPLIVRSQAPHHLYLERVETYSDMSRCIPLCNKCHFLLHKGRVLIGRAHV